jgi:hypothetical protein
LPGASSTGRARPHRDVDPALPRQLRGNSPRAGRRLRSPRGRTARRVRPPDLWRTRGS